MSSVTRWLGITGVLVALAVPAFGAENDGFGRVDPFYGSFGSEVPIRVPKYHNLEPTLKLLYSSGAPSGLVGVSWALSGLSYITRVSPGSGSPRYDATDQALLDGMLLLPCTTQGGTHCTQIQNYTRIVRDTATDRWLIYGTNGNVATYTPQITTPGGTYRWALATVTDTHGNVVYYNYSCDADECYPVNVTYNNNLVHVLFYYEVRPDPVFYATGTRLLVTRNRLKTIDVQVNGARVRSYAMTYAPSATTQQSTLQSVQQFGSDATLDSVTFGVTGGTSLPAMQFAWAPEAGLTFGTVGGDNFCQNAGLFGGDFDGDGLQDLVCHDGTHGSSTNGQTTFLYSYGYGVFDHVAGPSWCNDYDLVAADVNADGRTDLVCLNNSSRTISMLVSSVDTSTTPPTTTFVSKSWTPPSGAPSCKNMSIKVRDLNGDGKADLLCHDTVAGTNVVAISNGDGTFTSMNSTTFCPTYTLRFGDFNGDGRTDLLCYRSNGIADQVAFGNGDGTFTIVAQQTELCNTDELVLGDFNADGKTDVACHEFSTGKLHTYLSLGNGSWSAVTNDSFCSGYDVSIGDFNNDGRTDLLCHKNDSSSSENGNTRIAYSMGDGTFTNNFWANWCPDWPVSVLDLDGDGKVDLLCHRSNDGTNAVAMQTGGVGNYITRVDNGAGGTTVVTYAASSTWTNTYLPVGLIIQTVSRVSTTDGRTPTASNTDYTYAGGLWLDSQRRFLGFRKVTGSVDAMGDVSETYYRQNVASLSKVETTYFKTLPSGAIYSYSQYQYTESGADPGPYTSLLTSRWNFECDQGATCRRSLTQLEYDQYSNVTATLEYGDYDVSGDERTTRRGYYPNTSAYIVSLPGWELRYDGIVAAGASATPISSTYLFYDLQAAYTTPPTRGDLTTAQRWDDSRSVYVTTTSSYDSYGNVQSATDPLGTVETTTIDNVYHMFVEGKCKGGQCSVQHWDPVLEQVQYARDLNAQETDYTYDKLGRLKQVNHPDGGITTFSYVSIGDPVNQHIHQVLPDGAAGVATDTYQDGLGRIYRTVKTGGFEQDVEYVDASTRKAKESRWYGPGDTPQWINYTYDGAQRIRFITNPDSSFAEIVYDVGKQTIYDENRYVRVVYMDAYGRTTAVQESTDGQTYTTAYAYDSLDRLVKITDANLAVSTFQYDSLGRKLQVCTPDQGCLRMSYDAGGAAITQRDNKGQCMAFTYDALGRMRTKRDPQRKLTTWDYDETGHGTSIGRITTVRYPGGSESHTYSIMGLETGVTRCVGTVCATVNQTFDVASRLRSVTYPDGELVNYGYDTAGRLYSVSGVVNAMTWSPGGQLKTATFANGTTATYNYRAGREWVDSAQLARGATVLYQMTYGHDNAARVMSTTSSTNPTSNLTFTYDGLNRLKTVTGSQTQSFVYDGVGNLTSNSALGSYAYGDSAHEHAVTTAGNLFYTYDLNGNLTREEVGSGCDRTPRRQMTWDGQNKLVGVQDGAGVTIASFDYGADGQRIMKQTVGDTTYYLGPLLEWSVGLAAFTKYYYAGPMMVARQSAGVRYFYHQDSLGSIRVITDASGNVVKSYDYTAYGGIASSSGTLSDPFQFGGHRADTESSLVYMGSRYYEPTLGRFLNPDPLVKDVERPQTLNRYAYALNSPVDHSDPTGHLPVIAAILAVIAVAAFHASWVSITFAILGAALTIAGYALHNPFLSTIGGILLGFAGGYAMVGGGGLAAFGNGILGAAVAGVTSPLSPLDPGVKMAIGWAWTAYGLLAAPTGDTSNPPIDIEAEKAAQSEIAHALATNDDALLMKGIQDAAAATGSDPAQLTAQIQDVIARASQQGKLQDLIQEVNDTPWQTDFYGSPLHVAYSNQASALAAAGPDHLQIDPVTFRLLNPTGGLTGPGSNWSGLFASPYIRGWLGLHSINHDALGFLFNYVGTGPGYTGAGPFSIELFLPGASPGNPLLGQVSGIAMQGALHAPLATIDFIR